MPDILWDDVDLSDMILIPAGEFIFGGPDIYGEDESTYVISTRSVNLPDYWIDRTPVTFRQYKVFLDQTGHMPPFPAKVYPVSRKENAQYLWTDDGNYPEGCDDLPVVFVSYGDAMAYAEWSGKCLPTELEWEKAARGTDGRRFPWGDDAEAFRYCNSQTKEQYDEILSANWVYPPLTSVFAFPQGASPYGCLDMVGNVQEWCCNWFYDPVPPFDLPDNEPYQYRIAPRLQSGYKGAGMFRCPARTVRGSGRVGQPLHSYVRESMDIWSGESWELGFRCIWKPTTLQRHYPEVRSAVWT